MEWNIETEVDRRLLYLEYLELRVCVYVCTVSRLRSAGMASLKIAHKKETPEGLLGRNATATDNE